MEETPKTVSGGKGQCEGVSLELTNGCQERRQLETRMKIRERTYKD